MGGIVATWRFRIAKMVPFPCPKFFKRHFLQNPMLDWAKTWWGIIVTQKFRIVKVILFRYPRWPPRWPSWNSSNDISSQNLSQIEPKLDGRHQNDIKSFWSDIIWDGPPRWPFWKSSNLICSQLVSQFEPKLVGRHWGKMFSSNIQNGGHGSSYEPLQTT